MPRTRVQIYFVIILSLFFFFLKITGMNCSGVSHFSEALGADVWHLALKGVQVTALNCTLEARQIILQSQSLMHMVHSHSDDKVTL